jgi:Ni/Co efflux regulator RcnB
MKPVARKLKSALVLLVAGIVAVGPAFADKPSSAERGGGKEKRMDRDDHRGERRHDADQSRQRDDDDRDGSRSRRHFESQHQVLVRDYYGEQLRGGRCPPGLAKKHNGCLPPGQARKWQVGRPLPREVIYYSVPQALVVQIGLPPSGHRYVRVAGDILLIALGTGMVIDGIQDLGRY